MLRVLSLRLRVLVARSLLRQVVALRGLARRRSLAQLRRQTAVGAGVDFVELSWISVGSRRGGRVLALSTAVVCVAAVIIVVRQHEQSSPRSPGSSGIVAKGEFGSAEAIQHRDRNDTAPENATPRDTDMTASIDRNSGPTKTYHDHSEHEQVNGEKPSPEDPLTATRMRRYEDLRDYMLRR